MWLIAIISPFAAFLTVLADQQPPWIKAQLKRPETIVWKKSGVRFRSMTITASTVTTTHSSTTSPTATIQVVRHLGGQMNTKRVFPGGWTAQGCYTDTVWPRSLPFYSGNDIPPKEMTGARCMAYCDEKGYAMAGTEYAGECFCGNELANSEPIDNSTCNMPCNGAPGEMCGGAARMNLYSKKSIQSSSLSESAPFATSKVSSITSTWTATTTFDTSMTNLSRLSSGLTSSDSAPCTMTETVTVVSPYAR